MSRMPRGRALGPTNPQAPAFTAGNVPLRTPPRPPNPAGNIPSRTTPRLPNPAGNVPPRTTPRLPPQRTTPRPPNPRISAHGQQPYARPMNNAGGHGLDSSATQAMATTSGGATADPVIQLCQQLMEEARLSREEIKRISGDIRKMVQMIGKLEDSYKKLHEEFKAQSEATFSIGNSLYKDDLMKETGILFAKSLTRQPSREEIAQAVLKVLGEEGRQKTKFNLARTFCLNQLTNLRCEERRRVFANKPCEDFLTYTTEKFVDKILCSIIKAPSNMRGVYVKHAVILRKFAREVPNSRKDTYKGFREWLDERYPSGQVTDLEWEQLILEDSQFDYKSLAVGISYSGEEILQTQSPAVGISYDIMSECGDEILQTVGISYESGEDVLQTQAQNDYGHSFVE